MLHSHVTDCTNGCAQHQTNLIICIISGWRHIILHALIIIHMLSSVKQTDIIKFQVTDVYESLKSLKCGKSAGKDTLQSEHYKYAAPSLGVLLCMLFNACISHGYLPQNLMDTIIVPIIKDNKGHITDKDQWLSQIYLLKYLSCLC